MKPDALDRLHNFYQPPPPSWLPQTLGWYVIFALALAAAAWAVWRALARWRRDRYRRQALRELERINITEIPALLKRTALAAWRRETVASLSGEPWLHFLEDHAGRPLCIGRFGDLAYRETNLSPTDANVLRRLANDWIRTHHVRR
jgi:hypothetical protein